MIAALMPAAAAHSMSCMHRSTDTMLLDAQEILLTTFAVDVAMDTAWHPQVTGRQDSCFHSEVPATHQECRICTLAQIFHKSTVEFPKLDL
jgi:hypothetical protein